MTRPKRSVLVSWLLGAVAGAAVTLSFEALSAREAAPARCPVTGAVATEGRCPASAPAEGAARCPVTGATGREEAPAPGGRCPASPVTAPGLSV